mmetsp:Transcript_13172/g.18152  ORF Transcript_13172/g.18152 Transcript_13172/m.18152 type:complete len:200 (-) Transcript_13172:43-642(-)
MLTRRELENIMKVLPMMRIAMVAAVAVVSVSWIRGGWAAKSVVKKAKKGVAKKAKRGMVVINQQDVPLPHQLVKAVLLQNHSAFLPRPHPLFLPKHQSRAVLLQPHSPLLPQSLPARLRTIIQLIKLNSLHQWYCLLHLLFRGLFSHSIGGYVIIAAWVCHLCLRNYVDASTNIQPTYTNPPMKSKISLRESAFVLKSK